MFGGDTLVTDSIRNVYGTSDKGYLTSVYFEGTINVNGTEITSKGDRDSVVIKYSENNQIQWYNIFGGTGTDLITAFTEVEGGYIATGAFTGTLTLTDEISITAKGEDGIIIKYDIEGNLVWYDVISSSGKDWLEGTIRTKKQGEEENIVVIGNYNGSLTLKNGDEITNQGQDGIIICYDTDGNIKWHKTFTTPRVGNENLKNITNTDDGGFAICGTFDSYGAIDGKYVNSKGNNDGFIAKYDSERKLEWIQTIGSTGNDGLVRNSTN